MVHIVKCALLRSPAVVIKKRASTKSTLSPLNTTTSQSHRLPHRLTEPLINYSHYTNHTKKIERIRVLVCMDLHKEAEDGDRRDGDSVA